MKLLVTGASGFLGRFVVAEALRRGHVVRAMVRPGTDASTLAGADTSGQLELTRTDLRSRKGLVDAVCGVDGVIHLAAAKGGDVYAQYGGTVIATENLLWAMEQGGGRPRLVHISSFSVYDPMRRRAWSTVDEHAPVEADAMERDGYAQTKLVQERIVRDAAAKHGFPLVVIRPAMIYGRDNLWNAFCGLQPSQRLWLRTGTVATMGLTYVENTAEAIVLAAERDEAVGQTINIVDDDLPSRRRYVRLLQSHWKPRPRVVPVPWVVMRVLARSAWMTNTLLLRGKAKLPGLFIPCRLHARLKPFRYSNARAKKVLGWTPRYDLETAVRRSLSSESGNGCPPPRRGEPCVRPAPDGEMAKGEHEVRPYGARSTRVAYLTGEYPRATDTFIQREIAALRASGVHVETLSVRVPQLKEHVGPQQAAEKANTFYLLPPCPLNLLRSHARLLFGSPGRWFGALKLAWSTRSPGLKSMLLQLAYFLEAGVVAARIRERGIDHLHNHFADSSCSVAMLAAHLGSFPYSFTIHGPAEFFEPRKWRLDEKCRRAAFVACISHFCRSQMMCFADPQDWPKLKIVHCGVDPAEFQPAVHRGFGHRLLFVGRLAGVKGVPVLLEALAKVRNERPNVILRIAGDGPERAAAEALAERLGLAQNVRFLGYQTQAQVRGLLRETDVFVMASFAEGVPVVLMEAMASGVPVVSTSIAGVPELVEDNVSGRLVPPGDPDALARHVSVLLSDPEMRSRFGAAGRAKVEREFNLATEAARLRHVFEQTLAGHVDEVPTRPEGTIGSGGTKIPQGAGGGAVVKCA